MHMRKIRVVHKDGDRVYLVCKDCHKVLASSIIKK